MQVTVWMVITVAPLYAQEVISLVGSGSNLPLPLYSAWIERFGKLHPDLHVTYLALGTAQSIKEIREGAGEFGGGEIPLTSAQKHGGKHTLTQFPTVLVAIAPIYKLPGNPDLRFSGEVLGAIYLGNIKNWDDPKIAKLNPGVALPDLPITVTHLTGVKGSSYVLTDFLSKTSAAWKSKIGKNASPDWPVGVEANRSEGMVAKVSATPGAIGYVEFTYAKRNDLGYGSVQNAVGQFVKPTAAGIVPLENLEMSERTGLTLRSIILSSDADSSLRRSSPPCTLSSVRAMSWNLRTWRCTTKSVCSSAPREGARNWRQEIVYCGSVCRACGEFGVRCSPSSSQKLSWLGIASAFACSGPGRCAAANRDDLSFRASSGI